MYKKTFCFDIDGVICKAKPKNYKHSKPINRNIDAINKLHDKGHHIILFTARYMGRTNNNFSLAKKKAKKITITQLKKWKVKYSKIYFSKPSYDYIIDDKSFDYDKNWRLRIKKFF